MLRQQLLIVATAGVILFSNLGATRLWDRDEPRNAGCAAEMAARGDWLIPTFNGELRTHKPILLYWLIIAAYAVFGVSEFAARFPSALLAVGTCLLTYQIGRRLFDDRVGVWGAIILATSLMFDVAGRAATPDSALVFFSTLAIYLFVLGTTSGGASTSEIALPWFPRSRCAVVAMYAAMGVAVLAKGPVGMVLPTAVIGMYLLIVRLHPVTRWRLETASAFDSVALLSDDPQRNRTKVPGWLVRCARPFGPVHFVRTCWSMRPITAMVVVLVVALPWYVLVGWHTEGAWPRGFFLEHNLGRATAAMEGHRGGIWFYPLALLVGFFPWSVFAVPVVLELVARLRVRGRWWRGYALLTCWVAVYVSLFTIAQTKLPSYVTPCYPALALLTACFFEHWRRGNLQAAAFWPQCAFLSLGLVGVMMVTALPFAAQRFLPGEEWLGGVGVIPVVGAAVALWLTRLSQIRAAQYAMGLTAVFTTTAFFAWAAVRVDLRRQEPALLAAVARQQPDSRIGAYGALEPSWIFYMRRPVVQLTNGQASSWTDSPRRHDWEPRPPEPIARFFEGGDGYVITTRAHLPELKTLPPDIGVLYRLPYFLKNSELVVLGRRAAARNTPRIASPRLFRSSGVGH